MKEQHIATSAPTRAQNITAIVLTTAFLGFVVGGGWYLRHSQTSQGSASPSAGLVHGIESKSESIQIGHFSVRLTGELRMPRSEVNLEFRNSAGQLVDVGQVKLALDMNMPGMTMHSNAEITGKGGRYTARIKPDMTGDWMAKLAFNGPQGSGEKTFKVTVK